MSETQQEDEELIKSFKIPIHLPYNKEETKSEDDEPIGFVSNKPYEDFSEKENEHQNTNIQHPDIQIPIVELESFSKEVKTLKPQRSSRPKNLNFKAKRVVKIGKHIRGYFKDYSFPKLMKTDLVRRRLSHKVWWIDVECAGEADVEKFSSKFNLHPLTSEEILFPDSRETLEVFEERQYIFITSKELQYIHDSNELGVHNLNIITFKNFVVTFHQDPLLSVDQVLVKLKTREMMSEKGMQTSDWVAYTVLDSLAGLFENYVSKVLEEAEALEELVLLFTRNEQNDLLRRIGNSRKLVHFLKTHLQAKHDLIKSLLNLNHPFITADGKVYLRGVYDRVVRMEEKLSHTKDALNNLTNMYMAKISLEMNQLSTQVNSVMKTFSAVATIFLPLSFLASLFGMNVRVPGQENQTHAWFFGIAGAMLVLSLLVCFLFRSRGYV